jgi:hypothetical protein
MRVKFQDRTFNSNPQEGLMRYGVGFLVVLGLLVCSLAYADIPKVLNFQGRLTDASGKFVSDGNYSLTFKIYSDSTGGSSKWSETQTVVVSKGLFNASLGVLTPIPDSIFNYSNAWLGIQVGADPEMTPRQRLSSLGYAYRGAKADSSSYSSNSDRLDGLHASDFSSTATDYGRSGVATDLYEGTTTLTSKYVNEGQANSITSGMITDNQIVDADISASANITPSKISGTAWTSSNDGTGTGLDADLLDGQNSSAFLSTASDYGRSGVATDLYEGTSTLTSKYVNSSGPDSVRSSSGMAFTGYASGSSSQAMTGIRGVANNSSSGDTYGGNFAALEFGSGAHYGVSALAYGSTTAPTYGAYGIGWSYASGDVYGGYFTTNFIGTGNHFGVFGDGQGSSTAPVYGVKGYSNNTSSGNVYGGFFSTSNSGTGTHYGLRGEGFGNTSTWTYGTYGKSENTSTGNSYGGYFETSSSGTGTQHYGVVGLGYGSSSSTPYAVGSFGGGFSTSSGSAYGSYGHADNTSTGDAYGGFFTTTYSGTGTHYGVRAEGFGSYYSPTYGSYGHATNTSLGAAYGGYFEVDSLGTGSHYGIAAMAYGGSNSFYTKGCEIIAYNKPPASSGDAFAGDFYTNSYGTGQAFGVVAISYGNGGSGKPTWGFYGHAGNSYSGNAYGGDFSTRDWGTGTHYGVKAEGLGLSSSPTYGCYSYAKNGSSGNVFGGYFVADSAGSGTSYGIYAQASVVYWAGWFQGDLGVSRNLYVNGTKSSAVKVNNGEYRAFYSQESPENWFEDFGEGQLVNGKAHIDLDSLFLQTVTVNSLNPMKVFVQLEGDCNGVFVSKGTSGFDVTELTGGVSNVVFSYRVVAKRKGYEEVRLAKVKGPTPEQMTIEQAKQQAEVEKERAQREEEQKKMEQQRLEMEKEREKIRPEQVSLPIENKK